MLGVTTVQSCGLLPLSRGCSRAICPVLPTFLHHNFTSSRRFSTTLPKMGSTEQWSAVRVRETFIDYFKKKEHRFGISSGFESSEVGTNTVNSALLICRTTLRSYFTLRQCWHEPVQVHIPRNRRPFVGFCSTQACGQFAKGGHVILLKRAMVNRQSVYAREASIM